MQSSQKLARVICGPSQKKVQRRQTGSDAVSLQHFKVWKHETSCMTFRNPPQGTHARWTHTSPNVCCIDTKIGSSLLCQDASCLKHAWNLQQRVCQTGSVAGGSTWNVIYNHLAMPWDDSNTFRLVTSKWANGKDAKQEGRQWRGRIISECISSWISILLVLRGAINAITDGAAFPYFQLNINHKNSFYLVWSHFCGWSNSIQNINLL